MDTNYLYSSELWSFHSDGILTIANSTFSGNEDTVAIDFAPFIRITGDTPVTGNAGSFTNSTILGSFISSDAALTITSDSMLTSINNTISGSSLNSASSLNLYNTILANSSECGSAIAASSHNLIETASNTVCALSDGVNGNIVADDARIIDTSPYSNLYFELGLGSPAIDAGDDTICTAAPINNTAQNGFPRPQGEHCDIGSFEMPPVINDDNVISICLAGECVSPAKGTQGWEKGPINTRTGGYDYSAEDISIHTSAGLLRFTRDYATASINQATDLSPGWTHNHDTRLILPDDPDGEEYRVFFKLHSANLYTFYIREGDTYVPEPGFMASLVLTSSPAGYILTDPSQNKYTFDEDGNLLVYQDAQGHAWTYQYNSGKLNRIEADGGARYLDLDYDVQGRLESVTDQTGRSVSYDYDINGDLDTVTDVLGQTWTYEYDDTLDHFLTRVAAPGNVTVERTEFDEEGRAVRQYDGKENLIVEITYDDDGVIVISDALGHDSTQTYDGRGTLVSDVNAETNNLQKGYDKNFRPAVIIEPKGAQTKLSWGDNGTNLEYIKDALNNETFVEYENPNSPNNPTSIIDPMAYETKYFYEDTNFPTLPTRIEYPLSFDGGVSYVGTDYEYYDSGPAAGKVELVTDAQGNQTLYTYDLFGQIETVTTAYGTVDALTTSYVYDGLGRLEEVTDAQGVVTRNEYDDAGRLLKTIRNVHPTVTTQNYDDIYNITTEYRYDIRGNQIAVIDTFGVTTRTYYDLNNRPVTVVQNLSGQDIEDSDPPGRGIGVTDENIRMDTVYDDVGNVIETVDPAGIVTHTFYDDADRPELIIQNYSGTGVYNPVYPDQNIRTKYDYDANGNVIAMTDTLGVITRTYYDSLNRPVTVVQHLTGRAISVSSPPARGTTSNIRTDTYYDKNGNVIATVDPRGMVTRTYYDALNRPISVVQNLTGQSYTYPDPPSAGSGTFNIRTDTYYDEAGNVIATVDPRGVVTRTFYDSANRPVATVQNLTGQSIYVTTIPARGDDQNIRTDIAYDNDGRRDTVTDPLEHVTKYEYDATGQLSRVITNYVNGGEPQNDDNQRNIVTSYSYDALGRQVATTDTAGRVLVNDYDDLGRLISTTQNYLEGQGPNYEDEWGDRYNLVTTYAYDERGNQVGVTDIAGVKTRTYYDSLGRPIAVVRNLTGDISNTTPPERGNPIDPEENLRTDTVYLGNGNVDYVVDETGQITDYGYNTLGRLTTTTDPLSHITTFAYDANGNRTFMTDAEGVVTSFIHDSLNRLIAVVENYRSGVTPDHETNVMTEYTYDATGNRLSIFDGNDHVTSFSYTLMGYLATEADALGNTTFYEYDAMGNRVYLKDARNQETIFEYDELNRLALIDYPSGTADVSFEYDALGRRVNMTDGLGTTTWAYTNFDLPTSITDPFSAQVSYGYDDAMNRNLLVYPDGSEVSYEYSAVNRLEEVIRDQSTVASYLYDAAGRIKSVERANGVNTSYEYDPAGRLTHLGHDKDGSELSSYQYDYDNVGNRVQAVERMKIVRPGPTVHLTVVDSTGLPLVGISVYAFSGETYSGYSAVTDENGQAAITLPAGDYRFRADVDGTQFWSGEEDHCTIGECDDLLMTIPTPVLVAVHDIYGNPQENVPVFVFDGTTYTGYHGVTDEAGQVSLRLPEGSYSLRADFGGTQFWSYGVCDVPNCGIAWITVNLPTLVTVLDNNNEPQEGIEVYVFDGTTYTNQHATTDENGQAQFTLLNGSYRFRADFNGTQFWSGDENHCSLPGCDEVEIVINLPLVVTVVDSNDTPQQGIPVYVFDGATYTNYHGTTDTNGEVSLTLPVGNYRFRADYNGTQFWSGTENHCTVPGCSAAQITLSNSTTITVTDTDGMPKSGVNVYAFDGTTYTNYHGTTDANGEISLTLPAGSYRFRADYNGTQFWSDTQNHCTVPGCTSANVTVTNGTLVTVTDTDGTPKVGLKVYVFNGTTYTGYNATTNANGQVTFTLPQGSYRFRADYNGTQFWSGGSNHCTVPGCASAEVVVTIPVTVTVQLADGTPESGLKVYAFNGTTYTGYNATTNANGQVTFTLLQGDYRFRADYSGTQYWSGTTNHCTVPGCLSAIVIVGPQPTATATFTATSTPLSATSTPVPTATATLTPTGEESPTPTATATETPSGSGYQPNFALIALRNQPQLAPPNDVTVTVQDTDEEPQSGLNVYAFDETTYTGIHAITDENGQVVLTLPDGTYRFRADYNGTQFWSGETNYCEVPGCDEATITVTKPVTVTVWNEQNEPYADLPVYAFDGETYTGYHGTTDENGQVTLILPIGSYHFRTDYDGVHFWSSAENDCAIPGCESAAVTIPGGYRYEEVTISYDYDPLYRLTEANYSSGDYYHYTYDAVGNRLEEDSSVGNITSTITYTYDDANRIYSKSSDEIMVYYAWDNNGNLIYDGGFSHVYDAANRLTTRVKLGSPSVVTFYSYNGLGDRLREGVYGGSTTTYTMDLNAGLTQVLDDGTNTYLYGLGRISQTGSSTEYFLGDALGSVRQITDGSGEITLAKSYTPYGEVMNSAGSGASPFAFTGEQQDASGLTYLRARYYSSGMGRFITKDTWMGDYNKPLSLNRWIYVEGNPINFRDPSGFTSLARPCFENQEDFNPGNRYCILNRGGYIDIEHFVFKKNRARSLIDIELPQQFGKYFGKISFNQSLGGGIPIYSSAVYLTQLPAQGLHREKLGRITISIMMDYEYKFEVAQSVDPRCYTPLGWLSHCSSFSNEDLPSDYLGMVSAVKNLPLAAIVWLLGGGEQGSSPPSEYWGKPGDAIKCRDGLCTIETPYNNQCTLKIYDPVTKTYNNTPWPSSLIVEPFGFGVYWGRTASDFQLPPFMPVALNSNNEQVP